VEAFKIGRNLKEFGGNRKKIGRWLRRGRLKYMVVRESLEDGKTVL
jgi:hypothetical protein